MAESRMRRAAQMLRDPWGLLVAAVGGGAAWAVGLPLVGAGAVGVGMLAAAAAVGALSGRGQDDEDEPDLRSGTDQHRLVTTLDGYLDNIRNLQRDRSSTLVADRAAEALTAGTSARAVSVRVAAAVDDLDDALQRAGQVARQMSSESRVTGPLARMSERRTRLLGNLSGAVDGVGELYTKLLELSATAGDAAGAAGIDPVAELSSSLDSIREAFAELDTDAGQARESL